MSHNAENMQKDCENCFRDCSKSIEKTMKMNEDLVVKLENSVKLTLDLAKHFDEKSIKIEKKLKNEDNVITID
ncbi:hypothetical protein A3Q56_01114 [Intoshia linei]|uniref:Uncharacterized protein n=1 Tax=Intoshia linei TaxID=1819745 RepID=A0A177B9Z1_9BILA|nr:hypothetical protein A3Q56_01114 [Intoshia linei]